MRKFIILSRGRTGSNMLATALNSHPEIYCRGECFREYKKRETNAKKELNKTFEKELPEKIKARGSKLFYYHTKNTPLAKKPEKDNLVWKYIKENDVAVIHLKRRDKIKMYVSAQIASRTRYVAKCEQELIDKSKKPIKINVDVLKDWIEKTKKMEEWGDEWIKNNPSIEVYYKDLVNKWEEKSGMIQEFLWVDYKDISPSTLKQNREPLSFLIKNYDEIKELNL